MPERPHTNKIHFDIVWLACCQTTENELTPARDLMVSDVPRGADGNPSPAKTASILAQDRSGAIKEKAVTVADHVAILETQQNDIFLKPIRLVRSRSCLPDIVMNSSRYSERVGIQMRFAITDVPKVLSQMCASGLEAKPSKAVSVTSILLTTSGRTRTKL